METMIKILMHLFRLVDGRIPENVCRVMCTANVAGVFFSALCVDGPYTGRAVLFGFTCLLLACFFGSMVMMYEEVCSD